MAAFAPVTMRRITTATASSIIVGIASRRAVPDARACCSPLCNRRRPATAPAGRCLRRRRLNKTTTSNGRPPRVSRCIARRSRQAPRPTPSRRATMTARRRGMAHPHGERGPARRVYKLRNITECVHGRMRQNNLYQITVRGLAKAKPPLLHALSNNVLQGHRLSLPSGAADPLRGLSRRAPPRKRLQTLLEAPPAPWHRRSLDSAGSADRGMSKPAPPPLQPAPNRSHGIPSQALRGEGRAHRFT